MSRSLRPSGDIDLLVKEEDWMAIQKIMSEIGFNLEKKDVEDLPPKLTKYDVTGHIHFTNKRRSNVEFQLDILQLGLSMRTLDVAWRTAHEVLIEGERAKILSPEYQLIHLCVHLNKHGYTRLIWFIDIALLLKKTRIDWEKVCKIAKVECVRPSMYFTLKLVDNLFDDLVPKQALENLKPNLIQSLTWKRIWPSRDINDFNGTHEAALLFRKESLDWFFSNLILTGRTVDKVYYLARKLFPTSAFIKEKYLLAGQKISTIHFVKHYFYRIKERLYKQDQN